MAPLVPHREHALTGRPRRVLVACRATALAGCAGVGTGAMVALGDGLVKEGFLISTGGGLVMLLGYAAAFLGLYLLERREGALQDERGSGSVA